MKNQITSTLGAALVALAINLNVFAETLLPGQVDFGTFTPPGSGGEFVEVNLGGTLLSLASHLVDKEDADTAQLLNGLKLVKVNVVGMDDGNRAEVENRVQTIRTQLESNKWERVVTARERDQDVGVYLKTDPKDGVQGLTVLVMEGKRQAVFVNIVGNIKPEQLSALGEKLHLDPLTAIAQKTCKKRAKTEAPAKVETEQQP